MSGLERFGVKCLCRVEMRLFPQNPLGEDPVMSPKDPKLRGLGMDP